MYAYIKAIHIIFIVTWFSGMFYIVRLFIYHAEANEKADTEKVVLLPQFKIMIRRLWLGITWPSAIITLVIGPAIWYMYGSLPNWLIVKLIFVLALYLYHFSLHVIYKQQMRDQFRFSAQQLRVWNEVATIFLVSIVMLVVVKESLSVFWGLAGLLILVLALLAAIRVYKNWRKINS